MTSYLGGMAAFTPTESSVDWKHISRLVGIRVETDLKIHGHQGELGRPSISVIIPDVLILREWMIYRLLIVNFKFLKALQSYAI